MNMLKHIGKRKDSGVRLAVVFMKLDDEPNNCLVADIDSLNDNLRDDLMEAINSSEGQNSRNLYDILHRRANRGTGTSILESLHNTRSLMKLRTDEVVMTPSSHETILLSELNNLIRKINDGTEDIADEVIEHDRNVRKQHIQDMQEDERTNIGKNLLVQAEELEIQSRMLVEEANKKRKEAQAYLPKPKATKKASPKLATKETQNE
jgi:hypothetical protein